MQKQLSGYLKVLYDANAESIGARYQKMSSTTANKKKKRTIRFWAVAVWLFVWQAVSVWIGQEILLVSPVVVLERLTGLVMEQSSGAPSAFSLYGSGSFFLAAAAGILAAGLSAKFERIREFLLLR